MRCDHLLGRTAALFLCLVLAPNAVAALNESGEGEDQPAAEKPVSDPVTTQSASSSSQLRLDEITIEGEVDVPRVLFIESRDRLRRAEFLHHLFLRDVTDLGREAPLGHGISWTPNGPNEDQRGVVPSWTP